MSGDDSAGLSSSSGLTISFASPFLTSEKRLTLKHIFLEKPLSGFSSNRNMSIPYNHRLPNPPFLRSGTTPAPYGRTSGDEPDGGLLLAAALPDDAVQDGQRLLRHVQQLVQPVAGAERRRRVRRRRRGGGTGRRAARRGTARRRTCPTVWGGGG